MKIEKNKIVFGSVLAVVVIFIIAYSMLMFGGDNEESAPLRQTLIPELKQEQEDFKSKLDAVNALKEVRETNAPSIYDERFIDSLGYYDPDLRNKRKEQIVDSIYKAGRINYTQNTYRSIPAEDHRFKTDSFPSFPVPGQPGGVIAKELGLEHQLFYSSAPMEQFTPAITQGTGEIIHVEVDGNQVVKAGYRLRMRLTEAAVVNNKLLPAHTPVFGFISFQSNRALIEIQNIDHYPVKLKAFDLQDGSEGIYVENSIRADAGREVIEGLIQEIDIPGMPQVGGVRQVFQRHNRNVKVTVTNNYKLVLKTTPGY